MRVFVQFSCVLLLTMWGISISSVTDSGKRLAHRVYGKLSMHENITMHHLS